MKHGLVLMVLAASTALALVDVIHVDPVKAQWAGKVAWDEGVGQGLTCNFDTPVYADFFTGTATEEQYQVQMRMPGENGFDFLHYQPALA